MTRDAAADGRAPGRAAPVAWPAPVRREARPHDEAQEPAPHEGSPPAPRDEGRPTAPLPTAQPPASRGGAVAGTRRAGSPWAVSQIERPAGRRSRAAALRGGRRARPHGLGGRPRVPRSSARAEFPPCCRRGPWPTSVATRTPRWTCHRTATPAQPPRASHPSRRWAAARESSSPRVPAGSRWAIRVVKRSSSSSTGTRLPSRRRSASANARAARV